MPETFCPKCGKKTRKLVRGFCASCYGEDHTLVELPRELVVERCKRCEKVRLSGKWVVQEQASLEQWIAGKSKSKELAGPQYKVSLEPQESGTTIASVNVTGTIDGIELSANASTILKPNTVLCDPCMRVTSNYFECVIQLRYEKNPSSEEIKQRLGWIEKQLKSFHETDSLASIVDSFPTRKGLDVHIGSHRAGKQIAERLARENHSSIERSNTQTGVDKNGKAKKRYTYCVRL